ncbi:MAG TPA: four helix bundle protein [Candidatus Kryptobacter bacterium]|nr:four helix bundle protein [Candidatus Kryptobacter bacterium]
MKTYRDLVVWQKSMAFVTGVYKVTKTFTKEEQFGLVSQMRRCAVSIPSYIAEGYGRISRGDYVRFLQVAMGSLFEIQTQLQIALNLEFLDKSEFGSSFDKSREIERMLSALISKLNVK